MSTRHIRHVALIVAALLCAMLTQLAFPAPSLAHAVLLSSTPQDGQVLAGSPDSIVLTFSEAVEPSLTRVRIVDSHGLGFSTAPVSMSGESRVVVGLPHLPAETYRITWQTVSTDDRHQSSGVVVFGVGSRAQVSAPRPPDPLPSTGESVLQWIVLFGLGALAGSLALRRLQARRGPSVSDCVGGSEAGAAFGRSLRRAGILGGLLALPSMLLLAAVQAGGVGPARQLLTAPFGERSAVRLVATVLLLALVCRRPRGAATGRGARWLPAAEIGLLVIVVVSSALLGHAAGSLPRAVLDSIHLAFALVWCGSLIGVALAAGLLAAGSQVRRRRPRPAGSAGAGAGADAGADRAEIIRVLAGFGSLAAVSVLGLVLTGIVLAGQSARTVDALLLSTFGHILLVKTALALVAGLLGWAAHRRLRRSTPAVSIRSLVAEAVVLTLVLGGGAALASTVPPRGAQWRPAIPVAGSTTRSGDANGLVESIRISPNRPGHNFVSVGVFNTRRPAPAPIHAVGVELAGPGGQSSTVATTEQQPGEWVVPTDALTAAGQWTVTVRVSLAGRAPVVSSYQWAVSGATGGPATRVVSQLPAATAANSVAVALALLITLGLAVHRIRRRRVAHGARSGNTVPPNDPAPMDDPALPDETDSADPTGRPLSVATAG